MINQLRRYILFNFNILYPMSDAPTQIASRADLKYFINRDRARIPETRMPLWIKSFLGEESVKVRRLLTCLRKYEYYDRCCGSNPIKRYIIRNYYHLRFIRLSNKYNVHIAPHRVGPGLAIIHLGGSIQLNCISMGADCTVSAGVIVGQNGTAEKRPVIGDNVNLSVGCKVIGAVKIGNNCIVGPNSVVIKSAPDNSVLSGVPARILSINGEKKYSFFTE